MLLAQGRRAHRQAIARQAPAGLPPIANAHAGREENMKTNSRETAAKHGAIGTWAIICFAMLATPGILGCGSDQKGSTVTSNGQGSSPEPFTAVAQAADAPALPASAPESYEAVPADSLPPDIAVVEADSVAAPGAYVELAAQSSPDVVEVFLWDGYGRKQSLEFDASANLWHGRYRVPLGISAQRLGISVTAKNGVGLKHRVWTFIRIDREPKLETPVTESPVETQPEGEAERDSSGSGS